MNGFQLMLRLVGDGEANLKDRHKEHRAHNSEDAAVFYGSHRAASRRVFGIKQQQQRGRVNEMIRLLEKEDMNLEKMMYGKHENVANIF